jgi:hypothetical protein
MATYFYDQPTTNPRRSRYIYPTAAGSLRIFNVVELFKRTGFEAFALGEGFVYPRTFNVWWASRILRDTDFGFDLGGTRGDAADPAFGLRRCGFGYRRWIGTSQRGVELCCTFSSFPLLHHPILIDIHVS